MRRWNRWYLGLILIFLYAPILLMIIYSFSEARHGLSLDGFTLKWYRELWQDPSILSAFRVSAVVALFSSLLALVVGVAGALVIHGRGGAAGRVWTEITMIPLLAPDIVLGTAWLMFFVMVHVPVGYPSLILAHAAFSAPFVSLILLPALEQLNERLVDAAMDLGAKRWQAVVKVVLPQLRRALVSAFLMAMTLSLDDFTVSYFTGGNGVITLSVKIYAMTKRGISPKINALSTLVFIGVILFALFAKRGEQQKWDPRGPRR